MANKKKSFSRCIQEVVLVLDMKTISEEQDCFMGAVKKIPGLISVSPKLHCPSEGLAVISQLLEQIGELKEELTKFSKTPRDTKH